MVEHNYWMPREKATYLIAALNESDAHFLHGILTAATYEEVIEAAENRYGDHRLEAAFHSQLKRRIQLIGESLQEFPAAIHHLAHSTHLELTEYLISNETVRAFADGIK
jgi:hypothetical protein